MTVQTEPEALRGSEDDGRRRYGNWRRLGFTLKGVALVPGAALFVTIVAAVFCVMTERWWLMLLLLLLLAVEGPLLWPAPQGARYQRLGRWLGHKVSRRRGTNVLAQGPTGQAPDGRVRLPGLGAHTVLTEHATDLGDRFGLIAWPKSRRGLHTVVMQAYPSGTTGRDQSDIDRMVAQHGGLMKLAGEQGDVAGMAAIVETAPDTGLRLRESVTRGAVDHAPEYCKAVMEGTLEKTGVGTPAARAWMTFTFRGTEEGGSKKLPTETVAQDLGARLPHLLGQARLTGAGSGIARWCDAQSIIDDTRAAYDPGVAYEIEKSRLMGDGTGLRWEDVGPIHHEEGYKEYHHEGAVSRTWVWVRPPKAPDTEDVLRSLLAPHPQIPRKRVAVVYRPLSPEDSQDLAERGVKETRFGRSQKAGAATDQNVVFAKKAEAEENQGAVMVRACVLVTITAFEEDELRQATATVKQLAKRAHLQMRVAHGTQAMGFMQALPLGLVPAEFLPIPDQVRDQM